MHGDFSWPLSSIRILGLTIRVWVLSSGFGFHQGLTIELQGINVSCLHACRPWPIAGGHPPARGPQVKVYKKTNPEPVTYNSSSWELKRYCAPKPNQARMQRPVTAPCPPSLTTRSPHRQLHPGTVHACVRVAARLPRPCSPAHALTRAAAPPSAARRRVLGGRQQGAARCERPGRHRGGLHGHSARVQVRARRGRGRGRGRLTLSPACSCRLRGVNWQQQAAPIIASSLMSPCIDL